MEEDILRTPKVDLVDTNNSNDFYPQNSVKELSRRDFLKQTAVLAGAAALAGCNPKQDVDATDKEEKNFKENVREINSQYEKREQEYGSFNYEKYVNNYPGFEKYLLHIDKTASLIQQESGINKEVMKTLISSIVAANLNNWQTIDENKDPYGQRLGPMQFYPVNILDVLHKRYDDNWMYSIKQMEDSYTNIILGSISLVNSLGEIKNNGENRDLMKLTLAHYYDNSSTMVDLIKNNKNVKDYPYLKSNYRLYKKTVKVLESNGKVIESENETSQDDIKEVSLDAVWNRAVNFWPETNLINVKDTFYKEAEKFYNAETNNNPKLTKEELMSLFISVAMVESNGGKEKKSDISGALGWYQLVPKWKHLESYNATHNTSYTYDQIYNNDKISVEVGIWTLMRYRDTMNIKQSMKFFKGGNTFGYNPDDGIWWNRVSYSTQHLLGKDSLRMGYLDYFYDNTSRSKEDFLQNRDHIGNVYIEK